MSGFQWIDGSFVENIEMIENRHPNDIDLVTFYEMPTSTTQAQLLKDHPDLFNPREAKKLFKLDAYSVSLEGIRDIVRQTVYWYSLWSHTRSMEWKGFLQIDLNPSENFQEILEGLLKKYEEEGISDEAR